MSKRVSGEVSLGRFLEAMDGEWEAVRYEVQEDGKHKVYFTSVSDPALEWGTCPFNQEIVSLPKIGQRGRIGFFCNETLQQLNLLPKE